MHMRRETREITHSQHERGGKSFALIKPTMLNTIKMTRRDPARIINSCIVQHRVR